MGNVLLGFAMNFNKIDHISNTNSGHLCKKQPAE